MAVEYARCLVINLLLGLWMQAKLREGLHLPLDFGVKQAAGLDRETAGEIDEDEMNHHAQIHPEPGKDVRTVRT